MAEQACCFTGHRRIAPEDREHMEYFLEETIKEAIRRGADTFITGGALGFDTLAAEAVLQKKRLLPHLRLVLALPCGDHTKFWSSGERTRFEAIRRYADEVQVLSPVYHSGCMHARNRYMVDRSRLCIAYLVGGGAGGTRYTVEYAKQQGCPILLFQRRVSPCKTD